MEIGVPTERDFFPQSAIGVIEDAGATAQTAPLEKLASKPLDAVVLQGDKAVREAFVNGVTSPLLPVETRPTVEPLARDSLTEAIEQLMAGQETPVRRHGLTVFAESESAIHGLFEVALVTSEPASISAFRVESDEHPIDTYRSDGVVVASAMGSSGYHRAAGGPLLSPETTARSVVPISPYRTNPDHWIVDEETLTITITRDEIPVTVIIDEIEYLELTKGDQLTIERGPSITTLRLPLSRSPYDRQG